MCPETKETETPEAAGGVDASIPQRRSTASLKGTLVHVLREPTKTRIVFEWAGRQTCVSSNFCHQKRLDYCEIQKETMLETTRPMSSCKPDNVIQLVCVYRQPFLLLNWL